MCLFYLYFTRFGSVLVNQHMPTRHRAVPTPSEPLSGLHPPPPCSRRPTPQRQPKQRLGNGRVGEWPNKADHASLGYYWRFQTYFRLRATVRVLHADQTALTLFQPNLSIIHG